MAQSKIYSRVLGTGSYLPPGRVTNQELADRLAKNGIETSDEWIVARTGIHARHFAEPNVTTSDLALIASQRAIEAADIDPQSIDLIIVATSTPDFVFPSSACLLQNKLGIKNNGAAFDVQAVCSGFAYALSVADNLIRSGQHRTALVVGAETFSSLGHPLHAGPREWRRHCRQRVPPHGRAGGVQARRQRARESRD
jgi:3-oxoacyl-[acyl-carrier-protein] synthase III